MELRAFSLHSMPVLTVSPSVVLLERNKTTERLKSNV